MPVCWKFLGGQHKLADAARKQLAANSLSVVQCNLSHVRNLKHVHYDVLHVCAHSSTFNSIPTSY